MSCFPSWSLFCFISEDISNSVCSVWLLRIQIIRDTSIILSMHCLLLKSECVQYMASKAVWADILRHHVSLPEMHPMIHKPTWIENKTGFLTWSTYNFLLICSFLLLVCKTNGVSNSDLEISVLWLCGILYRIKLAILLNKETLSYSNNKNVLNKKVHLPENWQVMLHFDPLLSMCFGVRPGLSFARSGFPVLFQGMNILLFNTHDFVEYTSDGRSQLCNMLLSITSAFLHSCIPWLIFKSLDWRVELRREIVFPGFEHFLPFLIILELSVLLLPWVCSY